MENFTELFTEAKTLKGAGIAKKLYITMGVDGDAIKKVLKSVDTFNVDHKGSNGTTEISGEDKDGKEVKAHFVKKGSDFRIDMLKVDGKPVKLDKGN